MLKFSWGRGHPEEYTEAINMVGDDSRYDPMDDKKPRAGQILWIRGLTRLQTQVSGYDWHYIYFFLCAKNSTTSYYNFIVLFYQFHNILMFLLII